MATPLNEVFMYPRLPLHNPAIQCKSYKISPSTFFFFFFFSTKDGNQIALEKKKKMH